MLANIEVKDFMTTKIVTLTPDMAVSEAISKLVSNRITGAPVLDLHGQVIGMFTEMESMKVALDASYNQDFGGQVSDYMNTDVLSVDSETSIVELAEKFSKITARNYLVMEDVELVGIISRHDVLQALSSLHG